MGFFALRTNQVCQSRDSPLIRSGEEAGGGAVRSEVQAGEGARSSVRP